MVAIGDLTTLANVQEWLNAGNSGAYPPGDNGLLSRLITATSTWTKSYLSNALIAADYVETRNGTGTPSLFLRNRPVVSVASLTVNAVVVNPSTPPPLGAGYVFDDTRIYYPGTVFPVGFQNITVSYAAGFQAQASVAIPANGDPLKVATLVGTSQNNGLPAGIWSCDRSVTINGAAATKVVTAPAAGQYAVNFVDGVFVYQFNAADANAPAVITYGYVPADLEQAVIELLGERFKTRNRIGQVSQNLGNGQVVSYSQKDMNDNIKSIFNQYKNVVPV